MRVTPLAVLLIAAVGCSEYQVSHDNVAAGPLDESIATSVDDGEPGDDEWAGEEDPSGSGGGSGAIRPDDPTDPTDPNDDGDGDPTDPGDDDDGDGGDGGDQPGPDDEPDLPGSDEDPCRTIGYWQNHEALWPTDELELGDQLYDANELMWLLTAGGDDASVHLARQLIAAELNMIVGGPTDIAPVADDAHDWIVANDDGGGLPFGTPTSSPEGQEADALAWELDQYNNQECPDRDGGSDDSDDTRARYGSADDGAATGEGAAAGCSTTGTAPWAGTWLLGLGLLGLRRR